MTEANATLSTSTPPAATLADGDTPIFTAFRCWAETIRWANSIDDPSDAENNWRAGQITRCEREIANLAPIDARDIACLAWIAIAGLTDGCTSADPCAIGDDCATSVAFAAGVKALHPDIARLVSTTL